MVVDDLNRLVADLGVSGKDNARLIAAAPDLLAALESTLTALRAPAATAEEELERAVREARAAVAKATGEE